MRDDEVSYHVVATLVPEMFIVSLQQQFIKWAFGPKYYSNVFNPAKLIDLWNEKHGDSWIITEEEPPHKNFEVITALWEAELMAMLYSYFDSSPTQKEEN